MRQAAEGSLHSPGLRDVRVQPNEHQARGDARAVCAGYLAAVRVRGQSPGLTSFQVSGCDTIFRVANDVSELLVESME
jgi:hypothetical protein